MTYSASVLLNVVGGEPEGNAFFHLVQLQNGFSSCYNGFFGHSTAFVDFSLYQNIVILDIWLSLVYILYVSHPWKAAWWCAGCLYPNDQDANFCQACGASLWTPVPLVSQHRFTSTLWYIYGSTVTVYFWVEMRGCKPSEKSQGCPTSQVQCPKPVGWGHHETYHQKELSLHVRQKTHGIHVTTMPISKLPEEFSGPQRSDTLGVPLLDHDCIWTIWESEQDIAYLQDPEVVQL